MNNWFDTVILLDIDGTLFHTEIFRNNIFNKLYSYHTSGSKEAFLQQVRSIYKNERDKKITNPKTILKTINTQLQLNIPEEKLMELIIEGDNFFDGMYDEVEKTIQDLSKKGITLGILSTGETQIQKTKISSIQNFINEENIHIYNLKDTEIDQVFAKYKDMRIYVIDDFLDFLLLIKKKNNVVKTVWINRKNSALPNDIEDDYLPDYQIKTLDELLTII